MAEIKIEKKKPIWPWILLVLVVLAIIAYLVYSNQEREDYNDDVADDYTNEQIMDTTNSKMNDADAYNTSNINTSYNSYSAFEESMRDSTRIALDSSYTKKAYFNLTKSTIIKYKG